MTDEQRERTLSTVPQPTMGIPRLIHDYASIFAECRRRSGYVPYSDRQRFAPLTDADLSQLLDQAKRDIANRYGLEPI